MGSRQPGRPQVSQYEVVNPYASAEGHKLRETSNAGLAYLFGHTSACVNAVVDLVVKKLKGDRLATIEAVAVDLQITGQACTAPLTAVAGVSSEGDQPPGATRPACIRF